MGRFSPELLKSRLTLNLTPPPVPAGLMPAGVLVPLFLAGEEPHLLFTQRTWKVKDHRGQISFPGGVQDPEDPDLLATAIRETQEEIGLDPDDVEILGSLQPIATITGYWITAYPALIPYPYDFSPNPREVRRLLFLPVQGFSPRRRWSIGTYQFKGRTTQVCYWRYRKTVIWGATARILLELLARLGESPFAGGHAGTCLD
jgi:8-oxo-dGTP pyrophosphatase MutT (NUDIX family)